jgi:ribosomal protein L37AE/L43A
MFSVLKSIQSQKTCKECGSTFTSQTSRNLFCCKRCSHVYRSRKVVGTAAGDKEQKKQLDLNNYWFSVWADCHE